MNNNKERLSFSKFFILLFFLLSVFKLYLVSNEEIISTSSAHDDLWYVLSAERKYWFSNVLDLRTIIHTPIYPMYIALVKITGIPLRVGIELTFILAGLFFVYSLRKIRLGQMVCLLCFILIIFHPLSFSLFNHTLSETLYTPLLLFSISSIILMLACKNSKKRFVFSFQTGIFLSLLWFTRDEGLLIAVLLGFLLLFILIKYKKNSWKERINYFCSVLLFPIVLVVFTFLVISLLNYYKYGVFAVSETHLPSYKGVYKALLKVKQDNPKRFVPVPYDVREAVYSISPSFKELEPYLEDTTNFAFYYSKKDMNIDDMAAGWFYWMLRDAVQLAGYKTPKEESSYYNRVIREVNNAIKEHKIENRFVLFSFIDPNSLYYFEDIPASFIKIFRLFFDTNIPSIEKDYVLNGESVDVVNVVANRRLSLVKKDMIQIIGWAFFNDLNKLDNISFKTKDSEIINNVSLVSRPDLLETFGNNGNDKSYDKFGFVIEAALSNNDSLDNYILSLSDNNGIEINIPYADLVVNNAKKIYDKESKNYIYYGIDKIVEKENGKNLRKINLQNTIWVWYGKIILWLSYISVFLLVLFFCLYKKINLKDVVYVVIFLLLFIVLPRMMLFTLIDINSWNGAQPRYLFPVMVLYGPLLLIFINQAISLFKIMLKEFSG